MITVPSVVTEVSVCCCCESCSEMGRAGGRRWVSSETADTERSSQVIDR